MRRRWHRRAASSIWWFLIARLRGGYAVSARSDPLGSGRGGVGPFAERHFLGTKGHRRSVYKRMAGRYPDAVHEGAVGAAAVLDRGAAGGDRDARVFPRHADPIDPDRALRAAADEVVSFDKRQDRVVPAQPPAERGLRLHAARLHVRGEAVAAARHRPHEPGGFWIVAKGPADLGHSISEVGIEHHRVGQKPILKIALIHERSPPFDQDLEEVERLRREVDGRARAPQLTGAGIEFEVAELQLHGRICGTLMVYL